jgi:hypothetical protein
MTLSWPALDVPRRRPGAMRPTRAAVALVGAAAALALAGPALAAGRASAAAAGSQRPPGFLSVQGQLVGVTTISPTDAWATGDTTTLRDRPLLAHWDGRQWAVVKSPALPGRGQLYRVAKFPGGAFAVGFSGASDSVAQPLILRLAGTTASRVPAPSVRGGQLLDVTATSKTSAWAVGQVFRGRALVLHWNGTAWRRTILPARLGATVLGRVAATSAANAWAVGNTRSGRALILHWNGRRWSRAAFPAPGGSTLRLRGLTATSAANAWAVGFTGGITDLARTVTLHWDGRKWQRVPSQDPQLGSEGDGFLGVSASSARRAWAVGGGFSGLDGAIMIERWNGSSWRAVPTPVCSGNLDGVSIGPSGPGWAVGQTLAASEAEGTQTLILRWDGTAWRA